MSESSSASARTGAAEEQYNEDRPLAGDHADTPRFESWLGVILAGLIPMIVALFVPRTYFVALATCAGVLLVTGVVMFVASERQARRRRS